MVSKSSLSELQQDLRSPRSLRLRRGLMIIGLRIALLLLFDCGAIALAWLLAIELGTPIDSLWTMADGTHLLPIVLIVEIGVMAATGLYQGGNRRRDYWKLARTISLANLLLLLMAFLIDPNRYVSRSIFVIFWLFSILLTSLGRMVFDLVTQCVRRYGAIRHSVYLICSTESLERNTALICQQQFYNLLGVADSTALDRDRRDSTFAALQKMGISEVFVSWDTIKNRLHLCWYFQSAGITLRILPNDVIAFPQSQGWTVDGIPSLTVAAPMLVGSDFQIKRFFDFCAAVVLVTLLSPLYLLIAILIKLDAPGPIFFRQTRIGLHGRQFKVWKFRTMITNAEQLQFNLEAKNEMKDGVLFKMKDDPRVTRVGKVLRQYSLDELPQIFNVLMGEMSLVGPRPLPVRDVERFQERHFIRQEVLPGITGLWQVSGRSDITDFEAAVDLDLNYIANWSLWLDLKILLQTVMVVLGRKGAY